MPKVLVTGASGFIGKWLIRLLHEHQHEVVLLSRDEVDLLDLDCLKLFIDEQKPTIVFHLASQSSPFVSWKQPYQTLKDNIVSTLNMLQLAEEFKFKLVIPGSAEVYETNENPICETSVLNPRNPYGVSKLAIDFLIRQIAQSRKINVTLLRLFNNIGPEQTDSFVVSTFAKQLAMIKLNKIKPEIFVGNLDAVRDFVDVRDCVDALYAVSQKEEYGEYYNICSGQAYKIKDILDMLVEISGLEVNIIQDPERMRPSDVPTFMGDYSKIYETYGWQPTIPIMTTLQDTYEYWLKVEE